MKTWMVRSEAGQLFEDFCTNGVVALGWGFVGDLRHFSSRQQIADRLREVFPNAKEQSLAVQAGQLWRYYKEVSPGDMVVTYEPSQRRYALGKVISSYIYESQSDLSVATHDGTYPHILRVDWLEQDIPRDALSVTARNSLGSTLSFFRIPDNVAAEVRAVVDSIPAGQSESVFHSPEVEEIDPYALSELENQSKERLKDLISSLGWDEMQELVAGILRSMGYKTRVSPDGPDRGKDIIASPDGLGFEDPRIIVEVKHRPKQAMGSPEIRSFLGGRKAGEKGLYVSTGGFTKDARYEAERANIPLTLLTLDELVGLLLENYSDADDETRLLVPLRRIFWTAD